MFRNLFSGLFTGNVFPVGYPGIKWQHGSGQTPLYANCKKKCQIFVKKGRFYVSFGKAGFAIFLEKKGGGERGGLFIALPGFRKPGFKRFFFEGYFHPRLLYRGSLLGFLQGPSVRDFRPGELQGPGDIALANLQMVDPASRCIAGSNCERKGSQQSLVLEPKPCALEVLSTLRPAQQE